MFKRYGEIIIKFRWAIIVFWLAATVLVLTQAPNLADIAKNDQEGFLPANALTVQAAKVEKQLFPNQANSSTVVLTLYRESGLTTADSNYAKELEKKLIKKKDIYTVKNIYSPFTDKNLEETMLSKDKKAALFMVGLSSIAYSDSTNEIIRSIKSEFQDHPKGLVINMTGDAVMGQEQTDTVLESMEITGLITVFLVIAILLFIYRSPIAPFVPLVTIGISFLISRGMVAWLADSGLKVSNFTETFLIAILFGAGTDYCLLFISRFREELVKGNPVPTALANTLHSASEAIISSAGTVIIGFMCMMFAKFGLFQTTGPAVGVGVFITLLAVLTFTPAAMAILGQRMFWPVKIKINPIGTEDSTFWGRLADIVTSKPGRFIAISLVALLPFIFFSSKIERSFDELQELPATTQSNIGFKVIRNHFVQGEMMPVRLVLESKHNLWENDSLEVLNQLTINLKKVTEVEKVRSATQPLGEDIKEMSLVKQLTTLSDGMNKINKGFEPLQEGLDKMASGVNKAGSGLKDAGTSFGKLAKGTKAINQGVDEINIGLGALVGGVKASNGGLKQIAPGLDQIKGGLVGVNGGLTSAQGDLVTAKTALEALLQTNPALQNDPNFMSALGKVTESLAKVSATNTNLPTLIGGLDGSKTGITKVIGGLTQIEGGMTASRNGLKTISSSLTQVTNGQILGQKKLIEGANGLNTLADGLEKSSDGLGKMADGVDKSDDYVADLVDGRKVVKTDSGFYLPKGFLNDYPELKEGMEYYITKDGSGARMEIVLNVPPYTTQALDSIEKLKDTVKLTLKDTPLEGAKFHIGGSTAIYTEIRELTHSDFIKVMAFVLSGIFIVLVILLRSITAPFYLILTILLSYSATMGITYLVFGVFLDKGISWSVPFFAFNLLVALGVDYNIFLMSRVKEECADKPMTLGINKALASTGGIITSCGIIMAGTFGALMFSPINQMVQIGFATVVGLLLDTFVIRCILVPAIAVKLGSLNWWPSKPKMVKDTLAG